ncbi:MAG: AMP-binding protein [Woeseia sp.]|jgi:malonyl-CoA/methylmalonyl-CoA synthetase|nr:AMP-binding protein [Woeseia sp.]MBT6211695.1 AMP-binding protein [Woeseia sp.]
MITENSNLYAHFDRQITLHREKELLCTADDRSYTYQKIADTSAQIAHSLTNLGAVPGDRISVQIDKSPQSLCLYLACLRAGLVYHPLNLGYKKSELEYFLGNAEPTLVICDPANVESISKIAQTVSAKVVLTMDANGHGTLSDDANSQEQDFKTVTREPDDLAALLYSSGTTGVPKGIMLTHDNLLRNTESLVEAWGFTEDDRLLHALPIFHVHGLFVAIGCVMLSGASMRWHATYNAKAVIAHLPECTVLMGVPTYYTRLLAEPTFTTDVANNVRLFVSGSAPLLEETFTAFEARVGHRILERYGMTETNMNTSNPLQGIRKAGTVGPPLPGVDVRIADDAGVAVGVGEIGNLQVRGPNVFVGYWKMPDKTAEDFTDDGFFNTGDKGVIDEDGYVAIVGRAKDMVITGGLNVYPKEIELFIDDLDDVKESAVIGVPHPDFGEAVVAVVVPAAEARLSAEAIIAACKSDLADFKVPKRIIFANELPRNAMSKVQKNVLRDQNVALFN